ncbi:hypothetical protein, partial [Aeromonas sp. HZM]|uniref:hypothetical protein n=1 Tax=Aeromonas sp. HZM TaxID=1454008 RepID=UPI0005B97834
TEYPWSACQKAPSVTVTWGWGSCGLMVDLGNSAIVIFKSFIASDGEMISMNHTMPGEFIQFYG